MNLVCNLTLDSSVNISYINVTNGITENRSISGIPDGLHIWNVTCWDPLNNTNTSVTRNFTVDTGKPSVSLNYPPSGIITSNISFNFNWTVVNGQDTSLSCNLTIDGVVNVSNVASLNNTATNYSVSGFGDGKLRVVRSSRGFRVVWGGGSGFCIGAHGEADGGDAALRSAAAGLLAAQARRRSPARAFESRRAAFGALGIDPGKASALLAGAQRLPNLGEVVKDWNIVASYSLGRLTGVSERTTRFSERQY
jgi:hypothetical protein